jgi:hypothetical protein
MKRENSEWSDLSEKVTVDEQMDRLNKVIEKHCTCGGSDFDDNNACIWCKLWHYICHRTELYITEPNSNTYGAPAN